jgi:hypothetical protein
MFNLLVIDRIRAFGVPQTRLASCFVLGISSFVLVSSFEFRHSNFRASGEGFAFPLNPG